MAYCGRFLDQLRLRYNATTIDATLCNGTRVVADNYHIFQADNSDDLDSKKADQTDTDNNDHPGSGSVQNPIIVGSAFDDSDIWDEEAMCNINDKLAGVKVLSYELAESTSGLISEDYAEGSDDEESLEYDCTEEDEFNSEGEFERDTNDEDNRDCQDNETEYSHGDKETP